MIKPLYGQPASLTQEPKPAKLPDELNAAPVASDVKPDAHQSKPTLPPELRLIPHDRETAWHEPLYGAVNSKTIRAVLSKAGVDLFTKTELEQLRKLQTEFECITQDQSKFSYDAIREKLKSQKHDLRHDREKKINLEDFEAPRHIEGRMMAARAALKHRKRAVAGDAYTVLRGALDRAVLPVAKYGPVLAAREAEYFREMGFHEAITSPILDLVLRFETLVRDFVVGGTFICAPSTMFYGLPAEYL